MSAHRILLAALLLGLGCDSAGDAAAKAKNAADASKDAADKAIAGTKASIDKSKELAGDVREQTEKAKQLWADVPDSGELSSTAKTWLDDHSKDADGTIESLIVSGEQVAPVAVEIGKTVSKAVESERKVEPIYQKIEDGKQEDVDAAIGDMPRTEVIDGLTIGFKQLDETSNEKMVKERGYLVTWREGDHLIGFVYRSKRTIDVDTLVAETPRLVALTKTALSG